MTGILRPLRLSRPRQNVTFVVLLRRGLQALADPVARRRLRIIGLAALAPVVIACGVSSVMGRSNAVDVSESGPGRQLGASILAAPWTPNVPSVDGGKRAPDATARIDVVVEGLRGEVRTTLPAAFEDVGGDLDLWGRFVAVFAADLDVDNEARPGDRFRLLVEKRYTGIGAERRFLGYGDLVAAEYVAANKTYRAFSYTSVDGQVSGVFDEEGMSRRRVLLEEPLDVKAIDTSSAVVWARGEQGVSFPAPLGTPVWSTGDGIVVDARFTKREGNRVIVDHGGRLVTHYLHLARFADGIRVGARVKQRQVLGYVGSTGESAEPHLGYQVRRDDHPIDATHETKTASAAVLPDYQPSFSAMVAALLAQLRALDRA
jgi:murein DD-endopeptidase MepM/ murein hydrolase activator NlpD